MIECLESRMVLCNFYSSMSYNTREVQQMI